MCCSAPFNRDTDRTDPFLAAHIDANGEEVLEEGEGAKLTRLVREGRSVLRWVWTKDEKPEHLAKLLPALPSFLPGFEDLLLDGSGFTADGYERSLEDAGEWLGVSAALPLLAQAYDLDAELDRNAGARLGQFDPARVYLRNANPTRLSGLDDFRLRFYHLEDLSSDAEPLGLTGGTAKLLAGRLKELKPAKAFAQNHRVMLELARRTAEAPERLGREVAALKLSLQIATRTDMGKKRENNEDANLTLTSGIEGIGESSALFAVADGMGGHNAGEFASALSLELLRFYSGLWPLGRGTRTHGIPDLIAEHLQSIHSEIASVAASEEGLEGMGTTITGLFCTSQADITCETALATVRSFVFNVGDSRAFAVNAGGLRPLTRDHSLVQELLDAGNITEEEAQEHPQRNVISQGLGAAVELKPDVWPFRLPLDAYLVICSDGLTDLVRKDELVALAAKVESPAALADEYIDAALDAGGRDNITVIVLKPILSAN